MGKHTLVHVNNRDIQDLIYKDFGVYVPIQMVFCTKEKFYNSPLWFEMWDWDNEQIDYLKLKNKKTMTEYNSIEKKKRVLDETNSVTGGQLMIVLIAFLGLICIFCYMGSEFMKTTAEQEKHKEKIEINGKIYVEE